MNGLIPKNKIEKFLKENRRKRIVFTNGVFDIIHRGHVEYLTKARSFGDLLVVGLNTDSSVKKLKGPKRPINHQKDRAAVLLGLKAVDFVVFFSDDTPLELIKRIKPDVLVKGADYEISEIVGSDFVKSNGGVVRRVRLTKGKSTSKIITELKKT